MKRKEMLRQLLAPAPPEDPASPVPSPLEHRARSGAVRAMGLDLGRLTDEARRAEDLERQVASGVAVVEIETSRVDPSFADDRIARTDDAGYRQLVESIAAGGQQVPILVRPHPTEHGRYQVAYGHRRLAAAAELGIPVRAIVRNLSDAELVVAQGKENAERQNLSFIERALFAAELEGRGFDRGVVQSALAAHPAEMTRYLAVARSVPRWFARAVGPAPRVGRPRWMAMAELLATEEAREQAAALSKRADFLAAASDRRFEIAMAALKHRPQQVGGEQLGAIRGPDGEALIKIERIGSGTRLTVLETQSPGLSAFLVDRLPGLVAEFRANSDVTAQEDGRG